MTKQEIAHKQFAIVNVIVCFAIFFGLGFFLLVCQRESGFIQSENRNLAEKPKLTVQALLDGSLGYDPEARCDHHDHAHGAGHTCGEHGCGEHGCHS